MTPSRFVPARPGRSEVRERASRFLGFALPAGSSAQAAEELTRLRREYHDAAHLPFAWKVGSGSAAQRRSSDAGEPKATAGKPIAAAIEAAGVTDVVVAVVRYFGGTKLGTGGLARAYRESAAGALQASGRRPVRDSVTVLVACSYESLGALRRLLQPPKVWLVEERFGAQCEFRIAADRSSLPGLIAALAEARLRYRVEAEE